jgi:hypothetical protein
MKLAIFFVCSVVLGVTGYAAEPSPPFVNEKPFEPPVTAHPREIVAPQFLFPFELRRGAGAISPGEVVVLVQTDTSGNPKTLLVLSSRHEIFTRAAVRLLKKGEMGLHVRDLVLLPGRLFTR